MPDFIRSLKLHIAAYSLVAVFGFCGTQVSAQSATDLLTNEKFKKITAARTELKVIERYSTILELDPKILHVDGFDPEVIAVTALSSHQIRVQARTQGVTSMVLVDENKNRYTIEVFVEGDVRHLQAYIRRLFPDSAVSVLKLKDAIVLRGWVSQPDHITEIVEIAEQFAPKVLNQMKLGGVNQVQLRVKVMEVQRSRIRQLGFNWNWLGDNAQVNSAPGNLVPATSIDLPFGGPPSTEVAIGAQTIAFGVTSATSIFQGFLEALKQEGLLKILAEPVVVTTSGRPANFLAGGEFPILVPQSLGTVTIQWREFGVRLEAVPIVLGDGNLRLELAPEISERDFSNAVQVNGFTVPGLTTRRVNTQVEMKFGQTLAIGGLIATRETAETSKVPILGEMPWVGAAFRRVRYDENETELLITVTPELVAALDKCQVPPGGPGTNTDTPTDMELFFQGLIEVPMQGEYRPIINGSNASLPLQGPPMQFPPVHGRVNMNSKPFPQAQQKMTPIIGNKVETPAAGQTSPFPVNESDMMTSPVGGNSTTEAPSAEKTDGKTSQNDHIDQNGQITWVPENDSKPSRQLPAGTFQSRAHPVSYNSVDQKGQRTRLKNHSTESNSSDSEIPEQWRGLIHPATQRESSSVPPSFGSVGPST